MATKHKFASAKADGADATLVRPSNWNDTHTIANLLTAYTTNQTLVYGTDETIHGNAGASNITFTLPTAVGHTGERFRIMRINSTAGNIVLATTSSQTINGLPNYTLTNQYQFVELESDGANWRIWGGN